VSTSAGPIFLGSDGLKGLIEAAVPTFGCTRVNVGKARICVNVCREKGSR
jgi:hypothetical protein